MSGQRQGLIDRLLPARRLVHPDAPMHPIRTGQALFANTDTNAGWFLITDEEGRLADLTADTLGVLVEEAQFYGIKLKNMRIFGRANRLEHIPAGGRFYGIGHMQVAA